MITSKYPPTSSWASRPKKRKPGNFEQFHKAPTFGVVVLACFLSFPQSTMALDLGKCPQRPLGMESGAIIDDQITASTSFDRQSVGPQNARIRTEKASGAWCPQKQIKTDSYEYLQVNFNSTHLVTGIETQGRFGNGTGQEFTAAYYVEYYRGGLMWIKYRNRTGHVVLDGNTDTIRAVLRVLDPPIVASKIRIVPYSTETRTMCLRAEFYGCDLESEDDDMPPLAVYYSVDKEPAPEFPDGVFENTTDEDTIMGSRKGLGALTDGLVAKGDPLDPSTTNANSSWIGWKQEQTSGSVILLFEFETYVNFTDVQISAFGEPIEDIAAEFSENGTVFPPLSTVKTSFPIDAAGRGERKAYEVRMSLQDRGGRFLRLRINFDGPWLFLTEVDFNTGLSLTPVKPTLKDLKMRISASVRHAFYDPDVNLNTGTVQYYGFYYGVIVVLCLLFLFFLFFLCTLFAYKRRYSAASKKLGLSGNGTYKSNILVATLGPNGLPRSAVQHNLGTLPGLQMRNGSSLHAIISHNSSSISGSTATMTVSKDTPPSLLDITFPPPPIHDMRDGSEGIYSMPSPTKPLFTSSANATPTRKRRGVALFGTPQRTPNPFGMTLPNRIEDRLVSSDDDHLYCELPRVPIPIPFRNICIAQAVGDGNFTSVHRCTLNGTYMNAKDKMLVIKFVRDECTKDPKALKAVRSEIDLAQGIQHPHIVKFIASCNELPGIILEYFPLGNVKEYIQSEHERLSFASYLLFCKDIVTALKFLESKGVVHGHLTPSACFVSSSIGICIGQPRGPGNYINVRYAAPENVVLNEWTSKSDTWSFGVTAWEILHSCREEPFADLSLKDLTDRYAAMICNAEEIEHDLLFDSACCPPDIGDQLAECCDPLPQARPTLTELHMFLSRKVESLVIHNTYHRKRPNGLKLAQSHSLYH